MGAACPDIGELAELANAEGYSFVERTKADWVAGTNRFDRPGECFFLASDIGRRVGMCGLNRDPFVDDPTVGRLRHLYVDPTYRRSGVAVALVGACLDAATGTFDQVRLRTNNPAADALYRSLGFEPIDEDSATHSWRS